MPRETVPTPAEPREFMRTEKFLLDCRYVALVLGHVDEYATQYARVGGYDGSAAKSLVYRDDRIEIVADVSSLAMNVEYLKDGDRYNPIVFQKPDGDVIRCHGEHVHLIEHVAELVARCATVGVPQAI